MSASPTSVPGTVRSLQWATAIEGRTRTLPRLPRGGEPAEFVCQDPLAFRYGLDADPRLPVRRLFREQRTGESLLRPGAGSRESSRSTSDIVLVGTLRRPEQLRFRSFYLDRPRSPLTLVAHQRRKAHLSMPLVTGVTVQRGVAGRVPFRVPRVFDSGTLRWSRDGRPEVSDWSVEEALDGVRIGPESAVETARQVIGMLAETSLRLGVREESLDADERQQARLAFANLVRSPQTDGWPPDLDAERVGRRVEEVLTTSRSVTVGFSHGDPGLNNVLRLPGDGLALIDWEDAGRRMLAHDVVKVTRSSPEPLALLQELAGSRDNGLVVPGTASWPEQLAISMLVFLRFWRARHDQAVKLKRPGVNRRRQHTILRMVAVLLDAG